VWADKESRRSLTGRAFTYINLEVQLDLGVLAGVVMYGMVTAIHYSTNRTPGSDVADEFLVAAKLARLLG
jgi:hypothetical protein